MAKKSTTYWQPEAKGHLAAAHALSKAAPNLGKSAPVVAKKLASFRVAAKLAKQKALKAPKAHAMTQPPQLAPPSQFPPAGNKPLATKPGTPLKTSLPPKMPETPAL